MIVKKVCMLGGYAVGKTSLVKRFVHGIFSDRYLTTIGVKIEKKTVQVENDDLALVIWDLAGENGFEKVRLSYLRGASGYLLVADGTRAASLETAIGVHEKAQKTLGDVPFLLLMNKCDLREQWTVTDSDIEDLRDRGWQVLLTSAKDNVAVEEAFSRLSRHMLSAAGHEGPVPE